MMEFLRLLTLQIVEGRVTVESAQAIVKAKVAREREQARKRGYRGFLARQIEIAKAAGA